MSGKKILVVDDESKIRELLEIRLSAEGYEVISAKDGEEAVMMAKKYLPNLILMDVMMPKMDGSEAVGELNGDSSTKNIPVIFLTSMITKEEETNQAFGINLDVKKHHFIAKPFDTQSLLMEIQKVLNA